MILEVFIASFIVMLAALGGALSFWKVIGLFIEKHLGVLISFTAGLFLFVSYELGREAIAHSPTTESGLMWIFIGVIGIWLLFRLLPHSHEHDAPGEERRGKSLDIRKILTGNGIHNVGDGILLAAAFSVDFYLGLVTTFSVFIHELVQETSIFFILRKAGYSIKKAVLINFGVSGTILIGSMGSLFLISTFHAMEAPLLGISAGAFLVVVLQDLIPHSFHELRCRRCIFSHITAFLLGFLLIFSISLLAPHTHDHDHEHHEHEEVHDHHHDDEHHHD